MNRTYGLTSSMVKRIMWDREDMDLDQVNAMFAKGSGNDFYWLVGRMVERLEPREVTLLVNPDRLYSIFPKLRIWNRLAIEKAAALFPQKYHIAS